MAIKINGTTVIDDSRNLSNVGGLKTVNGTSLVGSGNISAGASTTTGAVGTYALLRENTVGYFTSNKSANDTVSGSVMRFTNNAGNNTSSVALSGTWKFLHDVPSFVSGAGGTGLFQRIS